MFDTLLEDYSPVNNEDGKEEENKSSEDKTNEEKEDKQQVINVFLYCPRV